MWKLRPARLVGVLCCAVMAVVVAACGNNTVAIPTPGPLVRGLWERPSFAGSQPISVSAIAFAGGDQRVGYACVATLPAAMPTPVPTIPSDATATPTPGIGGRPTPPTSAPTFVNAFWRTPDGGVNWQQQTIPPGMPNLLCPASAIVIPTAALPDDLFFLAGQGQIDLNNPLPSLPGQITYQLWRSPNGGLAWQALNLPMVPGTNTPVIISPDHLVILVRGQQIALASNASGADALFISNDAGQTWTRLSAAALTLPIETTPAGRVFAGFAAGAGNTLLALATTADSLELWQTPDFGAHWLRISVVPQSFDPGFQSQLFAAPNGPALYVPLHGTSKGQALNSLTASPDGGQTWTTSNWPPSHTLPTGQAGAGTIMSLGANFTVDALGTAYFAPPNSDAPLSQDPQAQATAGFYRATITANAPSGDTLTIAPLAAPPPLTTNTVVSLAVSLIAPDALVTPAPNATITVAPATTDTPTATATSAATLSGTPPAATATPTTVPVTVATATPTPVTGLPVLWTNFGPPALLALQPNQAGFFWNVLP